MLIRKNNTSIELSEIGLKIEIKTDLLLGSLISAGTKKSIEEMVAKRLKELLPTFEQIHKDVTQSESEEKRSFHLATLHTIPNEYIYEYACLTRDLYLLVGDIIDKFHEDNEAVMDTIGSIFKYSSTYGFCQSDFKTV